MVWSEYRDEVHLLDTDLSGSESEDRVEYTQEDWQDLNSEHLLNMWLGLREYLETYYLGRTYLQKAQFNDFCEFVYKFSG